MGNDKVLLIDRDKETCDFLSSLLKNEGYSVTVASDGKAGLEKAKRLFPNIVILDVGLPEIDGIEVCKELRSIPECESAIIIFFTSQAEDYTEIAAFEAAADAYIVKPVRARVLLSRLKALIRRVSVINRINLPAHLAVDKNSLTVTVNNKRVELSGKGFMLFELLASKPGKVFSRSDIHKLLWKNDNETDERVIDVYIWKLREKLGKNIIKTIKGVGYKIELEKGTA